MKLDNVKKEAYKKEKESTVNTMKQKVKHHKHARFLQTFELVIDGQIYKCRIFLLYIIPQQTQIS